VAVCLPVPTHHSDQDPRGANARVMIPNKFSFDPIAREVKTMSIFEKTKHCTKRFPCRFKLAMMVFSVAVIVSIITVPFIHNVA
jgi:hypothetical protein